MINLLTPPGIKPGEILPGQSSTGYGELANSGNRLKGTKLKRKILTSEIRRIAVLTEPVEDRMFEIRYLIEQYFKFDSNEEFLNANLP